MADKKINIKYNDFVVWEALPEEEKIEKTLYDYADKIGVSTGTLRNWRNKKGHWDRVAKIYEKDRKNKTLKVRDALVKKALKQDTKAIELYLKYEDKWNPTEKHEHNIEINGSVIKKALEQERQKDGENT